jgi:uncharacterized protein YjdB
MKKILSGFCSIILCISVINVLPVKASDLIPIDADHFPDSGFRAIVLQFDKNSDYKLDADEISKATVVDNNNIYMFGSVASLKGIEYLTSLQTLRCESSKLTSIDISHNLALKDIEVRWNSLSSLDVSKNVELEKLVCSSNSISSLDVSNNKKLIELTCLQDNLTSLDVSNNPLLETLECDSSAGGSENYNKISDLDISKNTALKKLSCNGNGIQTLDVTHNAALEYLNCSENPLDTLDLTKNSLLTTLYCEYTSISPLDISQNKLLKNIDCSHNYKEINTLDFSGNLDLESIECCGEVLYSVNISKNVKLKSFHCTGNPITTVDVTNNPLLESLDLASNRIDKLDLSNNSKLTSLFCNDNAIKSLDISMCPDLLELFCDNNNISSLDVSNCPELITLSFGTNSVSSIDISKNPKLDSLDCQQNKISTLDTKNNPVLRMIRCQNNHLTALDVSANSKLENLECSNQTYDVDMTYDSNGKYYTSISDFVPDLSYVSVPEGETISNGAVVSNSSTDVSYNYRIDHTPTIKDSNNNEITSMHVILNPSSTPQPISNPTTDDLFQNHPDYLQEPKTAKLLKNTDIALNECLRVYTSDDDIIMSFLHNLKFDQLYTSLANHMIQVDGNDYNFILANEKCAQKFVAEIGNSSLEELQKRGKETIDNIKDITETSSPKSKLTETLAKSLLKNALSKSSYLSNMTDDDIDDCVSNVFDSINQTVDTTHDVVEMLEIYLQIYDVDTELLDKAIEMYSTNDVYCTQLKKIKTEHFASPGFFIMECMAKEEYKAIVGALVDSLKDVSVIGWATKLCSLASSITTGLVYDNVTVDDYIYTIIMGGNYVLTSSAYSEAGVKLQLAKESRDITDADVLDFKQRYSVQMAMTRAYLQQVKSVESSTDQSNILQNYYDQIGNDCSYDDYIARCRENLKEELNPDAVVIKTTETDNNVLDVEPRVSTRVDTTYVPKGLSIHFNTPVTIGSGTIKLYENNVQGGADTLLSTASNIALSDDGKTASFDFDCSLGPDKWLYVLIDSGLFVSKAKPALSFAGISNESTWTFRVATNTASIGMSDFAALAASQFAYEGILNEDLNTAILDYAEKYKVDDYKYYLFKQELSDWVIDSVVNNNNSSGFCAVVLKNKYSNNYTIAYRGSEGLNGDISKTNFKEFMRDWVTTDFAEMMGYLSPQFTEAVSTYDALQQSHPDANIMVTGHSLGGTLANYVSYTRNVKARTFNSLYCMATSFFRNPDDTSKYFSGIDEDSNGTNVATFKRADYVNIFDNSIAGYVGMAFHKDKTSIVTASTYGSSDGALNHSLSSLIHVSDQTQHTYALNNATGDAICHIKDSPDITKDGFLTVRVAYNAVSLRNSNSYTMLGYSSNDFYRGDSSIFGNSKDAVFGGAGDDEIYTFRNSDVLVGGTGNDELHGGDGNDLYVYNNGDGVDVIDDPQGKDVIHINGYTSSDVLNKYIDPNDRNYLDITINSKVIMKVNLNKQTNSSIDIVYNNSSEAINCDTYIINHPLLWLQKYDCPVKVQFINSNGEVVAELGDEEKQIINEYGYFYSVKNQETGEYEKTAYVFGDLKTKVIGTDTGTMDMSTEKMDDSNNSYVVQNVPVNTDTVVDVTAGKEDTKPTILMSSSNGASTLNPIEHNESSTETIVPVSSISLGNLNAMVNISRTIQLNAGLEPSNATDPTVVWSSSDTSVASVDQNGTVLGLKKGSTVITATSGNGYKATSNITVLQGVSGISLSETAKTLNINDTLSLSATVYPADASNTNYTWSSSNDSVASVSNGTVTAKAGGTAIITATTADGSHQASCTVTVNYPPAPVVEPTPVPAPAVEKNDMYRLYNPNSGEHFFTANSEERDYLSSIGWSYEGVAWTAPKTSNTPVYRLYNGNGGEHHYTTSMEEANVLTGIGWSLEGIGWYSDDAQGQPLYRMYNPNAFANNHHYTTSEDERDYLVSIGWSFEGTGWYGCN